MKASHFFKLSGLGLGWLALITGVLFLTTALWNALIPELFHGPVLTFWQTTGLIILSKIFLTGFAHGGNHHHGHHHRGHGMFRKGERPSREEWLKRFNEMNTSNHSSEKTE